MSRDRALSSEVIKQQVAEGEPVVIHEGHVLHLGDIINRHPGGRLAILHMVGRDATDEINMYAHNIILDPSHVLQT
jgi:delta8-fatty-acid desaturase